MPIPFWTMWAARLLAVLGDTLIRSTLLALACLLLTLFLHRRSAGLRHLVWHGLLLALLLMPVLQAVLPPIRRAALVVARSTPEFGPRIANREAYNRFLRASVATNRSPFDRAVFVTVVLAGLYIAGAVALLLRLAIALYHLRRLSDRSQSVFDADLQEQIHLLWLANGCGVKPRVCESAEIAVPLTLGISQPVVLLPYQWRHWDHAKREAVLIHELAHVERSDTTTLLLASLATCLYWFHPLAWILKRHLALLAEQSCDERVVRRLNPESYASILVEIARDLEFSGRRLLAPVATAPMVKSSQMKLRLERILSATPQTGSGSRVLRLAVLAGLPALAYLTAAGHFERQVIEQIPQLTNDSAPLLSANTDELELQLSNDPASEKIRSKLLMSYYAQMEAGDTLAREKHDTQLLWLITNHPEATILGSWRVAEPARELPSNFQPHYQDAESLWTNQLSKMPNFPAVLGNASAFFHESDAPRALALLRKARELDPKAARYVSSLAWFYAQAEIMLRTPPDPRPVLDAAFAQSLHQDLISSADAALLSDVGSRLLRISQNGLLARTALPTFARQLMDRAVELDPTNPQWNEAIRTASLPRPNAESLAAHGAVSIGPKVMESSLTTKADPVYPPLALQARIQGSVVFNVSIDKDGSIRNIELASGHPLLANAAREALMQYRYRPTLLNGNPVAVVTQVTIRFTLPSDSN